MWNIRLLLQVASLAGPSIFKVVRKYGPEIKKLVVENPELGGKIRRRLRQIAKGKDIERTRETLPKRIAILREQITYLYASANTPELAAQMRFWRSEVAALENALPLLGAMSVEKREKEILRIHKRLDDISASLLELSLEDDIEDAQRGNNGENFPPTEESGDTTSY